MREPRVIGYRRTNAERLKAAMLIVGAIRSRRISVTETRPTVLILYQA